MKTDKLKTCAVCGKSYTPNNILSGELVRKEIADQILKQVPDWSTDKYICRKDLADFRSKYVHSLLESEKGDVSTLEQEVLDSLRAHELISANVETEYEKGRSFGERLADNLARFGGSWTFLICFGIFMLAWILMNSFVLIVRPPDPYPYILLNLVLSCLAAVQAPVIMMSQNRQEAKDRVRSLHDYQINLKAELEIRHLHEKIDHLLSNQWERLVQIQEVQLELLSELENKR